MATHTRTTLTSAGSFMPTLEPIHTTAAKAERRMDRLPPAAQGWADRLDLRTLELFSAVHRAYKIEGAPVPVSPSAYASRTKSSPDVVRDRLAELVAAGAVVEIPRIQASPLYRPVAKATATKAEGAMTGLADAAMGIRHKRDHA